MARDRRSVGTVAAGLWYDGIFAATALLSAVERRTRGDGAQARV
ncbi:hypothetical protein [Halopelagius longus]|nr:hypothetical protein [Halopelagius longus]